MKRCDAQLIVLKTREKAASTAPTLLFACKRNHANQKILVQSRADQHRN
jgi:hypothetical protein